MQLSLQLSKLQGTTSYFDENVGRVGVKSDTVLHKYVSNKVFSFTCRCDQKQATKGVQKALEETSRVGIFFLSSFRPDFSGVF